MGCKGQPIAIETPLGWSLLGPSLSLFTTNNFSTNFVRVTKDTVHRQIESLWETDFGDATSVLDVPSSREDRIVFKLMKQSVKQEDKHYILPLPWRPNVILPCDNRGVAERRLASLKKRFLNDKALHQKYTDVMELYLKKGHARKILPDEVNTNATKWYLPHHPVLNPKKPSKL